ncbi:family 49 glycosyl hydrolase [Microbacterium sp. B2969]|uniref:Family 49 glycosyl hydrolase n=1 Tax=Microbacterium alkaliflavum TaxID=3248839 RepID=A0ABW7Q2E3_9MICO
MITPIPARRGRRAAIAVVATLVAAASLIPLPAAASAGAPTATAPVTADSADLHTWWHDNADANATGPVAADRVRESTFYDVRVATDAAPDARFDSFTYMSLPRSGKDKVGYTDQDGAEFADDADLTMSWSTFEYATDVWVDVTLKTGQPIVSADQVTIRPTDLGLQKQLVDSSTIRVKVPYSPDGYRFSVEFDPQLYTAYNDMSGASGSLTTTAAGSRAVHTEPRNSIMVFAQPKPAGALAEKYIPTEADGSIYRPQPGLVDDLDGVTADILSFGPGTYYMGADHHAVLPANVKWVYLAPGAYLKGAFQFVHDTQSEYKVTGYGVLSGEQYVYEPDTRNGYQHRAADTPNCHSTCVKMLQFESSNTGQHLDLQGVTIAEPPYHSFVVYAHDAAGEIGVQNFHMDVANYQQVGSWYWQTDGIELYDGSTMRNTFFHSNDDVLKMYHSDVSIENTVIWKNENGPVIQWGWTPRNISDVTVTSTDVIHNRMYWKDTKYNTCIFNSSSHWEDMGATNRADTATTVQNMRFVDTRVEGTTNCALRVFALSNLKNVEIDGLAIDGWNDLGLDPQASLFKRYTDAAGNKVTIGDEMRDGDGLLLHDYTVGGESILKAGDNWASNELGRLNFDPDTWDGWNATADDEPTGTPPTLRVDGLEDGETAASRTLAVTGATDGTAVTVTVDGVAAQGVLSSGRFSADVTLNGIVNRVRVTATAANGVKTSTRYTIYAFGTRMGSVADPVGDDHGPGSYVYPSDGAFNPGSLDLTGLEVYRDGGTVRFVIGTAGEIHNPWGGNGMSTQRVNIYLRDRASTTATPLLPGTNTSARGAWSRAIVADGRYDTARFGSGVYDASLNRVADATLTVIPSGKIVSSVPLAALGEADLRSIGYQVSMFSDAEDGEGIGGVRPVYGADCWHGIECPWFVGPYRFGGGAGNWSGDVDTRDTDTSDSNAIDLITGAADQASVMDWRTGPVIAPYARLVGGYEIDAQFTVTSTKVKGRQVLTVAASNAGADPISIDVVTPYGKIPAGTLPAGTNVSYSLTTGLSKLPGFTVNILATAPDGTVKAYSVDYPGSKAQ